MADNSGIICDALLKTDPALYLSIDGQNSFRQSIKKRGARVAKYRRYVNGDHDATMTTQMKAMLRLKEDDAGFTEHCLNYMGIVVDKMAGRLSVNKIKSDNDIADKWIQEVLQRNDFTSIQGMMFRGAIRDADSYNMVDPQTLKWTVEPAYDGFSGVFALMVQGKDYPVWACKIISEADLDISSDQPDYVVSMKITVYQPGKITYWKSNSGGQEVAVDINADKEHEKAWPLGVIPIVHYGNLKDAYTQFGESEIRKAIPIQDALNRSLYTMEIGSEFSGFKITYSIGMEVSKSGIMPGSHLNLVLMDENGKVITDMTPEQVEFLKAVKVGELGATDISQYTNEIEKLVLQISHITSTPIYGITVQGNLSGEALKQLEIGLVGKCKRFQNENTSGIKLLLELTANMQKTFDTEYGEPPDLGNITVVWESPELRDNTVDKMYSENKILWETIANVLSKDPTFPLEPIFKSFGWNDAQIELFGTQKMEAIKLQQEDVIPTVRQ